MSSRGVKRSRSRSPVGRLSSARGSKRNYSGSEEPVRLFITNLPYDMKWQDLKDLFKEYVGSDVLYANTYEHDRKSSGSGVVEVVSRSAAERAIEKINRHEVMGRKIIVREETQKDRQRFDQREYDERGASRNRKHQFCERPTGRFSVELMNQLGINVAEITNQVFVANLDYKVTKQKLEEVFRIAGNVIEVELHVDKDGKSRGMGVVRFEHPIEAVQAISLFTSQSLYDRQMYVRMDRWVDPIMQELPSRLPMGLKSLGVGMGANGKPLLNVAEIANTLTLSMLVADSSPQMPNFKAPMSTATGTPMGGVGMGGPRGGEGMGGPMGGVGMGGPMGGGGMGGPMGGEGMGGPMGGGGMNSGMGGGMDRGMMSGDCAHKPPPLMDQTTNLLASMVSSMTSSGGPSSMSSNLLPPSGAAINPQMQAQALLNALTNLNNSNSSNNNSSSNNNFMPLNNNMNPNNYHDDQNFNNNYGNQNDPGNTTIFIKNLPYSFTTRDLYERFGEIGDIRFAEVKLDNQGKSKGYALLQYQHPEFAQRAINNMNGARMDGRPIEVRYDRVG